MSPFPRPDAHGFDEGATGMSDQIVRMMRADAISAAEPDAELIRLSRLLLENAVRLHRCDAGLLPMTDNDYEREHDKACKGSRVLARLHPVTMEGLVAKARAVRVQFERLVACDRGHTVDSSGECHERLIWSVLNDLLELTSGLEGLPTFKREPDPH